MVYNNNNNIANCYSNNNSIANCMVHLAKNKVINLKMGHNYSRNMSLKEEIQEYILIIKTLNNLCLIVFHVYIL